MTTKQFEHFCSNVDKHLSFKLSFDRSQAYIDTILKSGNITVIDQLICESIAYSSALEALIRSNLVEDNDNATNLNTLISDEK